jgi:hypothetical protein
MSRKPVMTNLPIELHPIAALVDIVDVEQARQPAECSNSASIATISVADSVLF